MPRPIDSAVVVITGASSGIGRLTAQAFAARGASVVLAARHERKLEDAAASCERSGGRALTVPTDVADTAAVEELARRAVERFGRIDVWVNNAGVIAFGHFLDIPADTYRAVIETNLFGQVNGARAALTRFREQGSGVLINVSSVWGRVTSPHVSSYVASKFAIRAFSECLRQELEHEDDVHVVTVLPQSVDTPIFRNAANYTGRSVRPVPPVVSAEEIAKRILACAEDPLREVTQGRAGHLFEAIHAVAPGLYGRIVPWIFALTALGPERADPAPGTVHEPRGEPGTVEDGWRAKQDTVLRRSALGALGAGLAAAAVVQLRRRR